MDTMILLSIVLFAAFFALLLFMLLHSHRRQETEGKLSPFTILPVPYSDASVRAFLELVAGQLAWMDSSVMQCLLLIHRDDDTETAKLCEEICRQYDFISCMPLSEAKALLSKRLAAGDT